MACKVLRTISSGLVSLPRMRAISALRAPLLRTSDMAKPNKKVETSPRGGDEVLKLVLGASLPRPDSDSPQGEKTKYAVRFADRMAEELAADLAPLFPGIEASTARTAPSSKGKKQLDINFSTPKLGLALGISLKSVHIREGGNAGRYTHNMKRNDEELGIEATIYHERQPYAVMVAILFLPFDSCLDAKTKTTPSSFGSWVRKLRARVGRSEPDDRTSLFEKGYIGLYEPDGGALAFFDIQAAPPKQGIPRRDGELSGTDGFPRRLLSYEELTGQIYAAYQQRNHTEFRWEDGEVEILSPEEEDS